MTIFKSVGTSLKTSLQAAPDSIQGYVNTKELTRVLFFSIAAGGGTSMILASLNESLKSILVQPADFALGSALLVAIIEIQRRLQHGRELPTENSQPAASTTVNRLHESN